MKLLVGLGNPGKEYINTRHNIGFQAVEKIAESLNNSKWESNRKLKSDIYKSSELILIKPTTFMNNSGQAVSLVKQMFKIDPKDIWVFHDELDIPLGQLKIQFNRGAAGHNGIKSIIENIGTTEIYRWRIGVGRVQDVDSSDYVLQKFRQDEEDTVNNILDKVVKSVDHALSHDLLETMNSFN
jgi:peptidyl-tRNA hydrolase, PTH1 family